MSIVDFSGLFFWTCFGALLYVYGGYYILLLATSRVVPTKAFTAGKEGCEPKVSVIVAAWNEENTIAKRLENLLETNYPPHKREIIVASDGSTDSTVEIASRFRGVRALNFQQNRGRAYVHNDSVRKASGDIVIFTDAETSFERNFLTEIVYPFSDERVGVVVGNLTYETSNSVISESEGFYFQFEKKVRLLESVLGVFATGTGACMAVRKELWRDLGGADDVDCATPLDVIMSGGRVVFQPSALAYDIPPASAAAEAKARIRQTAKDIQTIVRRWGLTGFFRHPLVGLCLISHKILRWWTIFFFLGLFFSVLSLPVWNRIHTIIFWGQIVGCLAALVGLIAQRLERRFAFCSTIFSFLVAICAMGLGSLRGLMGMAPSSYEN